MTRFPRLRPGPRDQGSAAIEAVIIAPILIMFICLALAAGRIVLTKQVVDDAAEDGARTASSASSASQASANAYSAAVDDFHNEGVKCTPRVSLNTRAFPAQAGQAGYVTVTVSCTVKLSDLLGFSSASKTLTSSWTSYVDTYEQRG